ncbi:hypothetical protein [Pseudoblastomonas halimionae]|uniref:Tetratricopeptide repeat protein n=1 Tax=Alteriqipengyuania halimionae TaxID=1926630 RepID=A0A6I4U6U7_9SPHN|nr:hypothetical protein [Alteriqipengyuania halimionae]MXP10017.1 hypothetical protein [Alteriqipengyuania halimionae]
MLIVSAGPAAAQSALPAEDFRDRQDRFLDLVEAGDIEQAGTQFDDWIAACEAGRLARRDCVGLHSALALLWSNNGRIEQAGHHADRATELALIDADGDPAAAVLALIMKGNILREKKRWANALAAFERATELAARAATRAPDDGIDHERLVHAAETWKATALVDLERNAEAYPVLLEVEQYARDNRAMSNFDMGALHYRMAIASRGLGEYARALDHLELAQAFMPMPFSASVDTYGADIASERALAQDAMGRTGQAEASHRVAARKALSLADRRAGDAVRIIAAAAAFAQRNDHHREAYALFRKARQVGRSDMERNYLTQDTGAMEAARRLRPVILGSIRTAWELSQP